MDIVNKFQYDCVMHDIDRLMKKGEANLSADELAELKTLAQAAEVFEDRYLPLPA